MEDIVLLGIGGHAHSVVDSIEAMGKYHIVGFLDGEDKQKESYRNYPVLGTDEIIGELFQNGIKNAFVTVGYMGKGTVRERLYYKLSSIGYSLPAIVDPSAEIANDAKIGQGTFVGKKAVVNSNAVIGNMCIINTGTIVEHDCLIGDFSHLAVGCIVCGNVTIGNSSFVGAGSIIIQGVEMGDNCFIGAGEKISHKIGDDEMCVNGRVIKREFTDVSTKTIKRW